jgi:hypothetical protein
MAGFPRTNTTQAPHSSLASLCKGNAGLRMKRSSPTALSRGPQAFCPHNLKPMRALAESWPQTVIVQQPVAQLVGSRKGIVHPLGAQLTWKQSRAVPDKLDSPPGRLCNAAKAVEHGWSRDVPVRRRQGGHRNCATAGCTNVPAQVRNCASSPCTNRSAGGGICAAVCCTNQVALPYPDAFQAKCAIRLLELLTDDLVRPELTGSRVSSLKDCPQLYLIYPQIRQSPSGELPRNTNDSNYRIGSGKSNLRRVSKRIWQTLFAELRVGSRYLTAVPTEGRLKRFLYSSSHFARCGADLLVCRLPGTPSSLPRQKRPQPGPP